MKYTVKNIYEADFGCEERNDTDSLKVMVYLESQCGELVKLEQDDSYLLEKKIDEGCTVTISEDGRLLKVINVVAAVIRSANTNGEQIIFATKRGYGEFKGGWEFPGGKIEVGETPSEALVREIKEELDTTIKVNEQIMTVEYDYPGFHLSMDCFWCEVETGELTLKEHEDAKWLTHSEIDSVNWLLADVELVERLREWKW